MSKLSKKIRAASRAEAARRGVGKRPPNAPPHPPHSRGRGRRPPPPPRAVAGDVDSDALEALVKAGVDFVVLAGPGADAAPLADQSVGRVMALDSDLDDTYLRLLGDLGLDALVIAAPEAPLTVERLLAVRRLSALARTPLLANAKPDIDAKSLELLRDSGVAGIVLDDAGKLAALKKRIIALPPRGRRKENHQDAHIPAQAAGGSHDDEEDDDYDDYDD